VITGFNTDVEHDGVVYHVQTEDKGLDSPIILSLVYSGGAILASKRAPYSDLVASGFNEAVLAERLKRQHRLICAAIHSGRIEDLKRMGSLPGTSNVAAPEEIEEIDETEKIKLTEEIEFGPALPEYEPAPSEVKIRESAEPEPEFDPEVTLTGLSSAQQSDTTKDTRSQSPLGEMPITDEGLVVTLLDEGDFRSGQSLTLRVLVIQRSGNTEKPLKDVVVSLKVLGTTFRPQIYSTKTQRDGVATVETRIPEFTSGRAAILVRAAAHGQSTEIRRIVHPGK
jgi:hypothetical protein